MDGGNTYDSLYKEIQCIGRGNFGSAWIVEHQKENKRYVSKKVILEGLSAKEQEGCMLEVNLLKNLKHDNIVGYKESFLGPGTIFIIMEYCDVGDLAFHIKRKEQKKGEMFTEEEIFNWFVQTCMALEYMHARKVIHRDIKTQNIFLTGSNTVKIGDFGISKVLESTGQQAMTVVGTPYYMAPEACKSEPYTSKSDVWSLGCVLFELCTLKKAFAGDNLMALVMKIVDGNVEKIPSNYSSELQDLINQLLEKDPQKRPSVAKILKMDIVRQRMLEFVKKGGATKTETIYKKEAPTIIAKQNGPGDGTTFFNGQMVDQAKQQNELNMTPKQKMEYRKRMEIEKREAELKAAATGAKANYAQAKATRAINMYNNTMNANGLIQPGQNIDQTQFFVPSASKIPGTDPSQNADFGTMRSDGEFGANDDRDDDSSYGGSQNFGTVMSLGLTQNSNLSDKNITVDFSQPGQKFSNYEGNPAYKSVQQPETKDPGFFVPDSRQLTGTGAYDLTGIEVDEESYYMEENFEETEAAADDNQLLNCVIKRYQQIIDNEIELQSQKSLEREEMIAQQEHLLSQARNQQQADRQMDEIRNKLGPKMFSEIYSLLMHYRSKDNTDEGEMYEQVKKMIGANKYLMTVIFQLDGLVFREILAQQQIN